MHNVNDPYGLGRRRYTDDPDDLDGGFIAVPKTDALALVNDTRDVANDTAAQTLINKLNNTPE